MFRSGKTLLAQMRHANPNIVCSSDPFALIFKYFRNSVSEDLIDTFDSNAPLHDYYLDRKQITLFQEMQERDFDCTSLDKWKQILKDEVLVLFDLFCSKKMTFLGCEAVSNLAEVGLRFDILYYEEDPSNCVGWIKAYDSYHNYKELSAELLCLELIESQHQLSEQFNRMLVLETSMYEVFCQQTSNP